MSVPTSEQTETKKKKALIIGIFSAIAVIACAVVFFWWLFFGRYEESTSDAYVHGNMIEITPQIPGFVSQIYVQETDFVRQNQVLVALDPTDQQLAYEASKVRLAEVVRTVIGQYEAAKALYADLKLAKARLIRAKQDYDHRKNLIDSRSVSLENYEHAIAALRVAYQTVIQTKHQLQGALALVENTSLSTHPQVIAAKEEMRQAYVNLKRCLLLSPADGIVTMRKVQVGESVNPTDAPLAVVPTDQIWVNANLKETKLKNIRIGQPVEVKADMYGGSIIFQGSVEGLNPGTGSVFSVLPPQNATGNWIKIVQRIPVRIHLERAQIEKNPLWLGLSMHAKIKTRDRSGKKIAEPLLDEKPVYQTDIFAQQIYGVDSLIHQVITNNVPPNFPIDETFSF